MIFSDEDLKRLKENVSTMQIKGMEALLARLEAAEAYIKSMPENVTDDNERLHKAWRKSAGK